MAQTDQRAVPVWVIVAFAIAVIARIVSHHAATAPRSHESLVTWVPINASIQRASAQNKPIFYEFSADWCGPCQRMEKEVFNDAQLAARINQKLVPVHVIDRLQEDGHNAPDVESLQQQYNVRAFPTIVIADANGHPLARMEGFGGREAFEEEMKKFLEDHR